MGSSLVSKGLTIRLLVELSTLYFILKFYPGVLYLRPESWQSVQRKRSFRVGEMCTKRTGKEDTVTHKHIFLVKTGPGTLKTATGLI